MEKFTFFWTGPLSNWVRSPFKYKGYEFDTSEQAMMWEKAITFDDYVTAEKILATESPKIQQQLGREVKNYVDEVWAARRFEVVKDILRHKFTQHEASKQTLLATVGTTLVEASPKDKIWGIGLAEGDPASLDRKTWQGQNLLGQALTEVRDEILEKINEKICNRNS